MTYSEYTGDDAAHDMIKKEQFMKQKYQEAVSYEFGIGVGADFLKAIEIYEIAASRGHPQSNLKLGMCYFHGYGVTQNINKAIKHFRKAGESGCALSCFTLGWIYDEGVLISKDDDKAEYWYTKSAEKGNGNAQYNLSQLCLKISEKTAKKSYEKMSIEWLELAVKNGHPLAQLKMGIHLVNKNEGPEGDVHANQLFTLSAEQGNIDALYQLGLMHLKSYKKYNIERDINIAFEFLNKAKDAGHIQAQVKIGDMYCWLGYDLDNTQCEKIMIGGREYEIGPGWGHYFEAAKKDNMEAKYKAGIILLNKDASCSDGLEMLASAAYGNYPAAKYLLSVKEICDLWPLLNDHEDFELYKDRFSNDIEDIRSQLDYASKHGIKNANLQLAKLYWSCYRAGKIDIELCEISSLLYSWVSDYNFLKYTEVPYCTYLDDISLDELISLAKSGDSKAQFVLGTRYAKGLTVSQDIEKAEFWYNQCIGSGDQEILCRLAYIYHIGDGVNADINKCKSIMDSYISQFPSLYDDDINYRRGYIALHHDKNKDDAIKFFELASRNSVHLGARYKLAKIYLNDNEKYEDGINMLISILYKKGIMSDLGECCLLALVSEFLDNVGNIARKNINDNVIVPVLDEILSLPTNFDDEIRKEVLYHIQY
ncbi:tetratricopeptide repeat protein [Aeromonas enteropelogenes]|uniref:tetratricopeptide repeat protein n=1 Tax=Aeromonas enteropelogenes TaxID=29489 RepID=UPI003BA236B7